MNEQRPREFTFTAVLLGIVLSVVMGAANVYLGLKAGITVSASIPAAVVAMGMLRLLGRRSVLESNLVQTAASAGESLAAGIIFTMPAMILVGAWQRFDYMTTTLIALSGGLLGILFMIPMRSVFVVDNEELKFPEGVACASVLNAGSESGSGGSGGVKLVFGGILVGGLFIWCASFLKLLRSSVEGAALAGGRVFYFGFNASPALMSVGYVVGLSIAVQICVGGALGWLIALPALGTEGTTETNTVKLAYEIWSTKIRYIGVGAMVVGGAVSIWKVRRGLAAAVREIWSLVTAGAQPGNEDAAGRNLTGRTIAIVGTGSLLMVVGIYHSLLQQPGITLVATLCMVVMSFFFAAVASYIVGLVGNSNSPVSGMTITAVLFTGLFVYLYGSTGMEGIVATLGVAGVVCCVACTAGDVCNDLKTGYLVGASPRNQQVMQILGVVVAAFVMAPVMEVLHQGSLNKGTGGIGGRELAAPQAGLFAALTEGFFSADGHLPWDMVIRGIVLGSAIAGFDSVLEKRKSALRLHVMPVAVGIYLPFLLSVPILIGGIINSLVARRGEKAVNRGVLLSSGIIAGESLVGVGLGFLAYLEVKSILDMRGWSIADLAGFEAAGEWLSHWAFNPITVVVFLLVAWWVYFTSVRGIESETTPADD